MPNSTVAEQQYVQLQLDAAGQDEMSLDQFLQFLKDSQARSWPRSAPSNRSIGAVIDSIDSLDWSSDGPRVGAVSACCHR